MSKIGFGIFDEEFIRDKVPMTKYEVRMVTLAKLDLQEEDIVLDIGAGSGSMSIECACVTKSQVYAIESNPLAQELIEKNIKKFRVDNLNLIKGMAPEVLPYAAITKVIIGGSRGHMAQIIKELNNYPIKKIVVNTITIENTYKALEALKQEGYQNIEVTQVSVSRSHAVGSVTMMKAENPIQIITGEK